MRKKTKQTTMRKTLTMLFMWVEVMKEKYPDLEMLFAVPVDAFKSITSPRKISEEGWKTGFPEICLPIDNGKFHSLWIKLKLRKTTSLTEKQQWWIDKLNEKGCHAIVCYGWEDARDAILTYLDTPLL